MKTVGGSDVLSTIFWPLEKIIDLPIITFGTSGDALTFPSAVNFAPVSPSSHASFS